MILKGLYDSHVHWMATGETAQVLDLRPLRTWDDLLGISQEKRPLRGTWWVGFGWNENNFSNLTLSKETLDRAFPNDPVFFSRADGHSSWLNTKGLEALGLAKSADSGILKEAQHIQALMSLPPFSREQKKSFLVEGQKTFNRAGFTHIRDMGGSLDQFRLALELEAEEIQSLHVVHNFVCENRDDLSRALSDIKKARDLETTLNKVGGIKIFLDGSMGSETAYLSQPYFGRIEAGRGQLNWLIEDLEILLKRVWSEGFDVAVHTIGDEAAHLAVQAARKVNAQGVAGWLHLEHVQVLRPETIQGMKSLHVVCHMQPCHWLSDQTWLFDKLANLSMHAFQWEALRLAKIPLFFGSDSPIEAPNLFRNLKALEDSDERGLRAFSGNPLEFHLDKKHPLPETFTRIEGGRVKEVRFLKKSIFIDDQPPS